MTLTHLLTHSLTHSLYRMRREISVFRIAASLMNLPNFHIRLLSFGMLIFISFLGHFTQVVWASTRYCGVGKARGRSGKLVVVAHYMPPGNVSGAYLENVLHPCEDYPRLPPPPPPRLIMTGSVTSGSESDTPLSN